MTTTSLPARLKAARKAAGFKTAKTFIDAYDIPPSTYSQHETGRRVPNDEALKHYSKLFGVNFDWLKRGTGTPYNKSTHAKQQILQGEILDLREERKINETLLETILQKLLTASQDNKLPIKTLAKAAATIYAEIISSETVPNIQTKMVLPAVKMFFRYK